MVPESNVLLLKTQDICCVQPGGSYAGWSEESPGIFCSAITVVLSRPTTCWRGAMITTTGVTDEGTFTTTSAECPRPLTDSSTELKDGFGIIPGIDGHIATAMALESSGIVSEGHGIEKIGPSLTSGPLPQAPVFS